VSRPRRPFGADVPGRLPATLLKVLAAELTDPLRLRRGKQLWADQAVVDIVVGHGVVTAEVQGSRREPYVVTLVAGESRVGVLGTDGVRVHCTCPDADGAGRAGCKHVVAALFAFADEVSIEPELMSRWRGVAAERARSEHPDTVVARPVPVDPILPMFEHPAGTVLPPPITIPVMSSPGPPDRMLAEVLRDALDHVRVEWS
jgi:SWIM zinc finger